VTLFFSKNIFFKFFDFPKFGFSILQNFEKKYFSRKKKVTVTVTVVRRRQRHFQHRFKADANVDPWMPTLACIGISGFAQRKQRAAQRHVVEPSTVTVSGKRQPSPSVVSVKTSSSSSSVVTVNGRGQWSTTNGHGQRSRSVVTVSGVASGWKIVFF
jgi:hypothetical protein